MKAWLLDDLEGISGLRLGEVSDPRPGDGEVLLKIDFAALNPADRYLAEGQYPAHPQFPHILGRDGVGTVLEVGPGVNDVSAGDRRVFLRGEVGINRPGTFAQQVVAPADCLVEIPEKWSEQESAGAALVYVTAYQALTQWGELPSASVVLITGASGGVGVATTQLASAMGHRVIALSRSVEKRQELLRIGVEVAFDPQDLQWPGQVKKHLQGKRVDLAVDNIGGALFPKVIETLGSFGKISVVGRLAGPVPEFNTSSLLFRRLRIGGVAVGTYSNEESRTAWRTIVSMLDKAKTRPLIDRVFDLEKLPEAFARLQQGPMGKVLLKVS